MLAASLWASLRALRNAQGRNRAILAAAVDSTVTIDGQGTVEGFNPAAERLFGYAADEMIGRRLALAGPAGGIG